MKCASGTNSDVEPERKRRKSETPLQAGNSGGPLLNTSGDAIGLTSAKLNAAAVYDDTGDLPQSVNYAIKVEYLKILMNSIGEPFLSAPDLTPNVSGKELDVLFSSLSPSIVMVEGE